MQKFAYFKDFYNQIGGSMSEEKTQAVEETVSEPTPKETVQTSSNDQFIAESKKYRKRAQYAEAKLKEYQNRFAEVEEEKLKEKEDFKALYEKVSSENSNLTTNAERWSKYEDSRRASLLEKHPEDDREQLSKLDLDTLEYVTDKINNTKANAPEVAGNPRKDYKKPIKDWTKLSAQERRDNWDDIVKDAMARSKANVKTQ
tara:strand:+ start:26 stop:628 length:603 start_codon:yes stop_codon:yes gene_type:complete